MSPTHSTKNGNKRYRYYVCTNAQKRGWDNCPSKSIPAGEIERFVIEQLQAVGRDPALVRDTVAHAQSLGEAERSQLLSELRGIQRDLNHWESEVRGLIPQIRSSDEETPATRRLADLQERIRGSERRATDVQERLLALDRSSINEADAAAALAKFDPVWEALTPREQARLIELLVERLDYDGATGNVTIVFHASGFRMLADESSQGDAA
jgi:site-specific DNA recombinase